MTTGSRQQELTAIARASFDACVVVAESGKVEFSNDAAREMFDDALVDMNDETLIFLDKDDSQTSWKEIRGAEHAETFSLKFQRDSKTVISAKARLAYMGSFALVFFHTNGTKQGTVPSADAANSQAIVDGIFEAALDPLFQVNQHGVIQMVNNAAIKQFGWTRNEFIGSNVRMIVGSEHAAKHDGYMERYLRTGESRVMGTRRELPARRKDGSEFTIQLSLVEVPVAKGEDRTFCGFVIDLTEHKRHVSEIQRRETFTDTIIEGSYDALLVTDQDGDIIRVNNTAENKFMTPGRNDLHGKSVFTFLSPKDAKWLKEQMEQFLSVGIPMTVQQEVTVTLPNGKTCPVMLGVSEVEGLLGEPCFALYLHDLTEQKKRLKVEAEMQAAEYLLFNMLPAPIADQLKDDPSHIAESHSYAAVLFADIVGFTTMSSTMKPDEVVAMLNELFSSFDVLVDKYDLNKIKTIGDCYMVTTVPGVSGDELEHCRRLCHFGLDLIGELHKYNTADGRDRTLDLRVGLHCGPVVAGVVGTKRFLYDLWGDAVNVAFRMESTGVPGRIQTTKHVAELMEEDFVFENRGMVQVKGKGEIETFFITEGKKEYQLPENDESIARRRRRSSNFLQDSASLLQSIRAFETAILDRLDDDSAIEND